MLGKTVVAISSTVMRGAVGLRPITFALEQRGCTAWPVPTVLLPWHPGLGPSTRTPNPDLAAHLTDLATRAADVDAILTGYFATAEQVHAAARFIDAVRAVRPAALVLVDPVTGDEGGRYVPDAVAEAVRAVLVPRADIVTPNVHELADLGGDAALDVAARALGARQVIVTSAVREDGRLGTLLWENGTATLALHDEVIPAPRGTGDLFSAVYLASLLVNAPRDAVRDAAAAVLAAIRASTGDMLDYAAAKAAIVAPDRESVGLRPLGVGAATARPVSGGDPGDVVYGVDGCRGGWAVVALGSGEALEPRLSFHADLADLVTSGAVMAIDMPIGLPDRIVGPGRPAEQAVRPLLGPRQSSVFSMPGRAAVFAERYRDACEAALAASDPPRKVSQQGFALFPAIRRLDALLTPDNQGRIFECHAEVAFWRLNGEAPMPTAKRVKGVPAREGLEERIALLERYGIPRSLFETRPPLMPLVDAVDAAAMALIARRCARGEARPFPDPPAVDGRGLRVAIWA